METLELESSRLVFDEFLLEVPARRLFKKGQPVRIQDQPLQMLLVLLEKPGEVVTREELRRKLWAEGTYVDFDNSLNAAMNKLREALGDSADDPRYVETLPRRGYRFVGRVQHSADEQGAVAEPVTSFEMPVPADVHPAVPAPPAQGSPRFWHGVVAGLAAVLVLAAAFMAWQSFRSPAVASTRVALAVLPFKNLSGDAAQDAFVDGLTEEMITQLGRLQPDRLTVVSSSSVRPYKASSSPIDHIGRALGVGYVLEGGVRREGNRARITAQLIHASDQLQVFSQTYEADAGNILDIQQDVAARIARSLEHELLAGPEAPAGPGSSVDSAAHAYMHGRFFWSKRTPDGVRKALDYFQQAVAADPTYAPAHAGIADCYAIWGGRLIDTPPDQAYPRARAAAEKALQLNPSLAEAHATLAVIRFEHDWDFAGADRDFRHAIELKPDYAVAHQWYAEFLASMGRHQEALVEIRRALALDPFSRSVNLVYGQILMYSRDYDAAIAQFRALTEMEPDFLEPYAHLNRIYLQQGKDKEFARYFLLWAERAGFVENELEGYRLAYDRGDIPGLLRERKRVLLLQSDRYYRAPYIVARIHALLGERAEALQWLEKAMRQRDDFITHITVDPEFDALRHDPRFQQLLQRIGLPAAPSSSTGAR